MIMSTSTKKSDEKFAGFGASSYIFNGAELIAEPIPHESSQEY